MDKYIEISTKITFEIPSVPNYIRIRGQEAMVSVSDLDKDVLKKIGEEWTKNLTAKSKVVAK